MTYYKSLRADGHAMLGAGYWPLPTEGGPGEWLEVEGEIIPCKNGLHACRPQDLIYWTDETLYELEYEGEIQELNAKVVGRKARLLRKIETWTSTTQRLLAADCAEHVLYLFEDEFPKDKRPRKAIDAIRRYARGEIDLNTMRSTADFAYEAAETAEYAAYYAAAAAYYAAAYSVAAYLAADTATAAAAAVYADAGGAGGAGAAYAAHREREWQTQRLLELLGEPA